VGVSTEDEKKEKRNEERRQVVWRKAIKKSDTKSGGKETVDGSRKCT